MAAFYREAPRFPNFGRVALTYGKMGGHDRLKYALCVALTFGRTGEHDARRYALS